MREKQNGDASAIGRILESKRMARRAKLHYVLDDEPGFTRQARGVGFIYRLPNGKPLRAPGHLARIASLVIPPAWTSVWICRRADGHLQVTGRDDRGRKQYLYHPRWCEVREQIKFDRILDFGDWLPAIRARVNRDLASDELTKTKVSALIVALMDRTAVRVGNREYARDNDSYGLTTFNDRHVTIEGPRIAFDFQGKSGKRHRLEVINERLAKLVAECKAIPGRHLFQYETLGGRKPITSADVNEYLAGITGGAVTAKDFRTWHATVYASALLSAEDCPESERGRKRILSGTLRRTAEVLGNTPTVCRKYYVHHGMMDVWMSGRYARLRNGFALRRRKWYRRQETLLLHMLNRMPKG